MSGGGGQSAEKDQPPVIDLLGHLQRAVDAARADRKAGRGFDALVAHERAKVDKSEAYWDGPHTGAGLSSGDWFQIHSGTSVTADEYRALQAIFEAIV